MGSYNTNPEHKQQQIIRQENNVFKKPVISRLINSIHYLIDTCFILELTGTAQGKDRYRLLAFHERENKIFGDKYYTTIRGARIGFSKQLKNRACIDNVYANWSDLYSPDHDWIEKMLSIVENLKSN